MKQLEYLVIERWPDSGVSDELSVTEMNELGAKGWELIQILYVPKQVLLEAHYNYYFKREKING